MAAALKRAIGSAFERSSAGFERHLGSEANPLQYLGALTIFLFWIVLVSGIWLLIFFRTSIDGAYASVEYLTREQWYFGGVMRSLHRYASDAAVVTMGLHILREWALDRYRGKHWFSWVTGVPLVWILVPLGITGYWLVWDRLAQYVALTSAELLDWLPVFTGSMARNFLVQESLSDRFFTLMAFLHLIGLPLFLVFTIWLHVFRITRPVINPPRALMAGALLALLAWSSAFPAQSQGQADLATVPPQLGLDWYYLTFYPLAQAGYPGAVWALLGGISLLLFLAPWLPPRPTLPVAVVDLTNCNGCGRCAEDCPYGAVTMQPRTDGSGYEQEAVVDPALCVACGICVGACPTATPFRQATALRPGIDLPDRSARAVRDEIGEVTAGLDTTARILVVGCDGSEPLERLQDHATAVLKVRCAAHLPPAFLDYVLSRNLAHGILLAGCAGGGCRYREGAAWTAARVARERDPRLRQRVDASRVLLCWAGDARHAGNATQALAALRRRLDGADEGRLAAAGRRLPGLRAVSRALACGVFALAAGAFSAWPAVQLMGADEAMVSISLVHAGERVRECRRLTQQELDRLPPNMRQPEDCPRERHPLRLEFAADGEVLFAATRQPSGLWKDGETTVYVRFPLEAGQRELFIGMADTGRSAGFDYERREVVRLRPGQHLVIDFDAATGAFRFRQERRA